MGGTRPGVQRGCFRAQRFDFAALNRAAKAAAERFCNLINGRYCVCRFTMFVSILRPNYIELPVIVQQKVVFKTRLIYQ